MSELSIGDGSETGSQMSTVSGYDPDAQGQQSSNSTLWIGCAIAAIAIIAIIAFLALGSSTSNIQQTGSGGAGGGGAGGSGGGGGGGDDSGAGYGGGGIKPESNRSDSTSIMTKTTKSSAAADFEEVPKWSSAPSKSYKPAVFYDKKIPDSFDNVRKKFHYMLCNFKPEDVEKLGKTPAFTMTHLVNAARFCTELVYDNLEYKSVPQPVMIRKHPLHHSVFGFTNVVYNLASVQSKIIIKWLGESQTDRHFQIVTDLLQDTKNHDYIVRGIAGFLRNNPGNTISSIMASFDTVVLEENEVTNMFEFLVKLKKTHNLDCYLALQANEEEKHFKDVPRFSGEGLKVVVLNHAYLEENINKAYCLTPMKELNERWGPVYIYNKIYGDGYTVIPSASLAPVLLSAKALNTEITPVNIEKAFLKDYCSLTYASSEGCCTSNTKDGRLIAINGPLRGLINGWGRYTGFYWYDLLYDDYDGKCNQTYWILLAGFRRQLDALPEKSYNDVSTVGAYCDLRDE